MSSSVEITEIVDEKFDSFLQEHASELIVVKFYAQWCKACEVTHNGVNKLEIHAGLFGVSEKV
jgi:thiol:disulfide interchange protein